MTSKQCNRYGSCAPVDKDLREQLHHEIEYKSKTCSNSTYECSMQRLEGNDFCLRHILRNPASNYRQCTFIYSNGKKCPNALPKHDIKKDPALTTLCFEHSRNAQLQKTHAAVGKLQRAESNETLLHSLAHHINVDEVSERSYICEQDEEIDVVSPHVLPFLNFEQINSLDKVALTVRKRRRILDYASDSSSDEEAPCMNNTTRGHDNETDDESIDSQGEDLLKHAGIYAHEETIRISEAKLTKLQGLYIDQINRLHHILKDRRRRYLHAIRKEREIFCSIHDQLKDKTRERILYEKLKALNTYHRRHGVEAVLYKKFKEKRTRSSDTYSHRGPGFAKCVYTEGGVKCADRTLPCCKFCRKHILEDKKQALFRACDVEKSGVVCQEPTPCIFDDATCVLHLVIPAKRQYIQKKYESETEEENEIEMRHMSVDVTQQDDVAKMPKTVGQSQLNVTISHDVNAATFEDSAPSKK